MGRIQTIIDKVRCTLADEAKTRWTDKRLLGLISDAQKDIVIHNELITDNIQVVLLPNVNVYELPEESHTIKRASSDGIPLGMQTYSQMDKLARMQINRSSREFVSRTSRDSCIDDFGRDYANWEEDTGDEVEALLYDNRDPTKISFYPIPDDTIIIFTYDFDTIYGVLTDIVPTDASHTFSSNYGTITDITDTDVDIIQFSSNYGIITGTTETKGVIKVWYLKESEELESVDDTLIASRIYNKALEEYTVAKAYLDDNDTRSVDKFKLHWSFYEREAGIAEEFSNEDGVINTNHEIAYRGAFE